MAIGLFLALQVAGESLPPMKSDLLAAVRPVECLPGDRDQIVVCANADQSAYRLPDLPDNFERKPPKAEIAIGEGVTGSALVEGAEVSPGVVSNRAMVRLKIRF